MSKKTDFALLGILTHGPQSGYDIKKHISQSIGYFWQESYGQLYPTLKNLVASGFAKMHIETNEGKPDKKVYEITKEGRNHLKIWLANPIELMPKLRHELLLKLFFGSESSPEICIKHLEQYKTNCQDCYEELTDIKSLLENDFQNKKESTYWLLTVSYGLICSKSEVEWCNESIGILKKEIK